MVREDYEGEVSTWVVIEREDGPESMFEVLWKPDGSYIGSAIGPAQGDHPSATLIYRGDDTYRGPLHRFDRTSPVVRVDHGETPALILGGERFTRGL